MNRKHFLGATTALISGALLPFKEAFADGTGNNKQVSYKKAQYLKSGDIIGITSPAGYISVEEIQPAITVMQSWGYKIKVGDAIGKKDYSFGGTDEERLTDFQKMLDDRSIKAIMCARGGYGSVRIVDRINWSRFKQHPKWVIGFSDITVLLNDIHNNCHIATIHSKMTNSFPDDWSKAEPIQVDTINSIYNALSGKKMSYSAQPTDQNKLGTAQGILVGGNLKTIETLTGSRSDISTVGKILFVEDTGEYLYSIDRMFWSLKRTGKLKNLKALIVGGFNIKQDDPGDEFGRTIQDIVLEKVKPYNYPVCFDFPVGHQRANFALKCGVRHKLKVTSDGVSLVEM
jgi:muramoyltetrapeptide carboxypeptidase